MVSKYDDIIDLPHHVSATRPQMTLHDRAAQFAPFAALTGYGDAVEETARHTDEQAHQSDDEIARLDLILRALSDIEERSPFIFITYFCHDERKSGGRYVTQKRKLLRVDGNRKVIVFADKSELSFCDIVNIDMPEETEL